MPDAGEYLAATNYSIRRIITTQDMPTHLNFVVKISNPNNVIVGTPQRTKDFSNGR